MERISETNDSSILTCALCKQRCRDPKVLPCLHVCCSTCVASVSSLLQSIRCRKCSEDVNCSKLSSLPQRVWYNEMEMNPPDVTLCDGRISAYTCKSKMQSLPNLETLILFFYRWRKFPHPSQNKFESYRLYWHQTSRFALKQ